MKVADPQSLHGRVVFDNGGYSRMVEKDSDQPSDALLQSLASSMEDDPDTPSDDPDPEENLYIPAGYTYFGQFVDHDLTFDTTSSLKVGDGTDFSNLRTPNFDLDNVYGPGPDAAPYMYQDGVRLMTAPADLPRSGAPSLRAIIGDPRNDENSIVCNLQMAFLRFHNAIVDRLEKATPALKGTKDLFTRAQNEVRWTYQRILVDDFLPRIVSNETLEAFDFRRKPSPRGLSLDESAFVLFPTPLRAEIPLEFSVAAYRFGHSMVRTGYRLNAGLAAPVPIFTPLGSGSLVGFEPLLPGHLISDWSLFFPDPAKGSESVTPAGKDATNAVGGPGRMQFAYKIDTTFVNPLAHLPPQVAANPPSLGLRNLLRGKKGSLASGQEVGGVLGVPILDAAHLVVRDKSAGKDKQTFKEIAPALRNKTPLWFYILAEAQAPVVDWWLDRPVGADGKPGSFSEDDLLANSTNLGTQLGETGGRIVLEVFHGLLDSDPGSYRNHPNAASWVPMIKDFRMWDLVNLVFR